VDNMKQTNFKTFLIWFIIVVAISSLIVYNVLLLYQKGLQPFVIDGVTVPTTGIVSAGPFALEVFEEDKTTTLTKINWGTFNDANERHHHSAWIYSPDAAAGSKVIMRWIHNAPIYLKQEAIFEGTTGGWYNWGYNISRVFPADGYFHIDFRLTSLPAAPDGTFLYDITLTTS